MVKLTGLLGVIGFLYGGGYYAKLIW
jgi:hypothetical protein